MGKVTIQDIADALGISRNTVSKAINNTDGLAESTREKILQKATEMGYKQFSYISTLKTEISEAAPATPPTPEYQGEIALFTPNFLPNSHFASLMLDRLQRELALLGYTLNTHRVTGENLAANTLPLTFYAERTCAILCIEMFHWDYDRMLCDLGLPVLFVDGPAKLGGRSLPADQLYMNNTDELTLFVQKMLDCGQRTFGFVGDYTYCQSFFERYTALRCALLLAGVTVDETHCIVTNQYEQIKNQLTSMKILPEVLVCANDFVAVDVVRVLKDLGKRIPEDVRICGFDDSHESRICEPPLTTIHIHTQIMAFSAANMLLSRIKEPSLDFRTVHTETDLICRDSSRLDGVLV